MCAEKSNHHHVPKLSRGSVGYIVIRVYTEFSEATMQYRPMVKCLQEYAGRSPLVRQVTVDAPGVVQGALDSS